MSVYRTAEIAKKIDVHPNTIRFYEAQGLLPPVPRMENGYRVFSERHLHQLWLIRCAFRSEILNNNLRNEAIAIVKLAAGSLLDEAIHNTILYQTHIHEEIASATEAIGLAGQILDGMQGVNSPAAIGRREAATQIGVSIHVLRDWERNGLISVPRKGNRRQYGANELNRLKVIRVLRSGGYSQMSIRRMLAKLGQGEADLKTALDTPDKTEDIISVTDRYITSLLGALTDSDEMLQMLEVMQTNSQTLQ